MSYQRGMRGLGAENCDPFDTACVERNLVLQAQNQMAQDIANGTFVDASHYYGQPGYDAYVAAQNTAYLAAHATNPFQEVMPDGSVAPNHAAYVAAWSQPTAYKTFVAQMPAPVAAAQTPAPMALISASSPTPAAAASNSAQSGYITANDVNRITEAEGLDIAGFHVPWWAIAAAGAGLIFLVKGK